MPNSQPADPETVLHGRIYINPELQKVPDLPPLCESAGVTRHPVAVGDCELFCEVQGEGTPLVLLHGGPGGTHHCFHHSFARASTFARVVYYDQRGCGQSGYVPGETGYAIDQAVADLDAVRGSLGADTWVVLGYSYGGLLAQCYAVKHPDRVSGLVLVGSSIPASTRLMRTRQYNYISYEERKRIREIQRTKGLSLPQSLYNAHLNGDWKRQNFYRPTRERLGLTALYEWKHDRDFNPIMGRQTSTVDLRGAFDECPVPTLIAEGKWDLTWNVDKPKKLHAIHPRARFELFDRSGHSPFDDEPDRFYEMLREIVGQADGIGRTDLAAWQQQLSRWQERKQASPEHRVRSAGWGQNPNRQTAEDFRPAWLDEFTDFWMIMKVGFALYDSGRYDEALEVFRRSEMASEEDTQERSVSLIWQGHVLDLLDRRSEALAVYQRAVDLGETGDVMHAQFGLEYKPSAYAKQRLQEPFVRIENRED